MYHYIVLSLTKLCPTFLDSFDWLFIFLYFFSSLGGGGRGAKELFFLAMLIDIHYIQITVAKKIRTLASLFYLTHFLGFLRVFGA